MTLFIKKDTQWAQCDFKACDEIHNSEFSAPDWLTWVDKSSRQFLHLCPEHSAQYGFRMQQAQLEFFKPAVAKAITDAAYLRRVAADNAVGTDGSYSFSDIPATDRNYQPKADAMRWALAAYQLAARTAATGPPHISGIA